MGAAVVSGRVTGTGAAGAASSVYLHPGQFLVAVAPTVVTTILGSCVSVCMHDARRRIAAINHFLLPVGGSTSPAAQAGRYGDWVSEELLTRMLQEGSRRQDVEAKVFGGACVLGAPDREGIHLGYRNVEAALAFLDRQGITVRSRDTGGARGRKLIYHTDTGDALVRLL